MACGDYVLGFDVEHAVVNNAVFDKMTITKQKQVGMFGCCAASITRNTKEGRDGFIPQILTSNYLLTHLIRPLTLSW